MATLLYRTVPSLEQCNDRTSTKEGMGGTIDEGGLKWGDRCTAVRSGAANNNDTNLGSSTAGLV